MLFKTVLFSGIAAVALSTSAFGDEYYSCNGGRCYDDQIEETRRLNLEQLENLDAADEDGDQYDRDDDGPPPPYDSNDRPDDAYDDQNDDEDYDEDDDEDSDD